MCGRPVFVLVVGAAVCCMLNKGALRWGTKKDKPLFNIQLLGLWFEPFVQWYQSPLPQQPKTNWSNCNTFTQTFFWGFSEIHGSSFCLCMATLVKSTFMGLRKPKLECCTNRFQYLAFASPVRVLNSMLWWHFGFKFCALAPWSVNFQSGGRCVIAAILRLQLPFVFFLLQNSQDPGAAWWLHLPVVLFLF